MILTTVKMTNKRTHQSLLVFFYNVIWKLPWSRRNQQNSSIESFPNFQRISVKLNIINLTYDQKNIVSFSVSDEMIMCQKFFAETSVHY